MATTFGFAPPADHSGTVFVELGPEGVQSKTGQYMVCPPAIHFDSGRTYQFVAGRAPWDILPAAETRPAGLARRILYGDPASAARLAGESQARYALVSPLCDDGRGGFMPAPRFGVPIYASRRLVILDLAPTVEAITTPDRLPPRPKEPDQETVGN